MLRPLPHLLLILLPLVSASVSAQIVREEFLGSAVEFDEFGTLLATGGDHDGDGVADIIVGAPFEDGTVVDGGGVHVYSGADGSQIWAFHGDVAGQNLGSSVANAGDVDNDGRDDILVGLHNDATNGLSAGAVRVYSGTTGLLIWEVFGDGIRDYLGSSVDGLGDVNGDGHDDFVASAMEWLGGSPQGPGYVRVYSGIDASVLHTFTGATASIFGHSVRNAGDVDDDTINDVVVGAIGHDTNGAESGRVQVYSGATGALLHTWDGDASDDQFGFAVDGAGDVDGDGHDDVMAGTWAFSATGYVRIFSGDTGALITQLNGFAPQDDFGHTLSAAGDVNGDGALDVIVGAPDDSTGGASAGSTSIFTAATGALLARIDGTPGEKLGYGLAGGSDFNGDLLPEFVMGGITQPGFARVVSLAAADGYGMGPAATHILDLQWTAGIATNPAAGLMEVTGASPSGTGAMAFAFGTASTFVSGVEVLFTTFPGLWASAIIAYDLSGAFSLPLNIRQPVIAGQIIYLQAFELNPAAPQGVYASDGLRILFGP